MSTEIADRFVTVQQTEGKGEEPATAAEQTRQDDRYAMGCGAQGVATREASPVMHDSTRARAAHHHTTGAGRLQALLAARS
jgi:hypothetical protein